MKIEDILASWEYNPVSPPKICEIHRLSIPWNGEIRPIIASLISGEDDNSGRYLALRLEGDDASWVFINNLTGTKESFLATFSPSASNIEKRIEIALRDNRLVRQFVFEWNETPKPDCLVTLSAAGYGFWDDSRFYFPVDDFSQTKVQTLHEMLRAELENSDSDLIFARQFSLLGPTARRARLLGLKSENQLEDYLLPLHSLWQWVILTHSVNVNMYDVANHLYRQPMNSSYRIAEIEIRSRKNSETPRQLQIRVQPEDRRLQTWAELLIEYGPIQLDFDVVEKHASLRDFLRTHGYVIRETCESFSAHEQLEAKLKLLEWAKEHLPPEMYASVEKMDG